MQLIIVGFSGCDGGKMRDLCDHNVVIPSSVTMNIQECHIALEHIFCMAVECHHFASAPSLNKSQVAKDLES